MQERFYFLALEVLQIMKIDQMTQWLQKSKQAIVVPIHMKGLKQNYRPISLLQSLSKIVEKLIFDSLYRHLN